MDSRIHDCMHELDECMTKVMHDLDTSETQASLFSLYSTECSRHQACLVTALQTRPGTVRCVFYPDTQICTHSLQAQNCQLLLREKATRIYRKLSKSTPVTLGLFPGAWVWPRRTV